MDDLMQSEEFFNRARMEQEKWINPVGRLILAAASIERSVNEILEFLFPEDMDTWKADDKRAERIFAFAKENLPDTLIVAIKNQKRNTGRSWKAAMPLRIIPYFLWRLGWKIQ